MSRKNSTHLPPVVQALAHKHFLRKSVLFWESAIDLHLVTSEEINCEKKLEHAMKISTKWKIPHFKTDWNI